MFLQTLGKQVHIDIEMLAVMIHRLKGQAMILLSLRRRVQVGVDDTRSDVTNRKIKRVPKCSFSWGAIALGSMLAAKWLPTSKGRESNVLGDLVPSSMMASIPSLYYHGSMIIFLDHSGNSFKDIPLCIFQSQDACDIPPKSRLQESNRRIRDP